MIYHSMGHGVVLERDNGHMTLAATTLRNVEGERRRLKRCAKVRTTSYL